MTTYNIFNQLFTSVVDSYEVDKMNLKNQWS